MQVLRPAQSTIFPWFSAARSFSSLEALLGGAPVPAEDSIRLLPQRRVPAQDWLGQSQPEQPGLQLPSLCGEPKNKLSLHRRGNRRYSYYSKRKGLFAHCRHCGVSGMPHEWYQATNSKCTGQCLQPPATHYPQEYKPPC